MFGQLLLFLSRFNFFLADSMFSHQLHPFLICSFFVSHADWHCFNHTQGNQYHPSEKKIRKTFLKLGLLDRDPNSRWRDPNPSKEPKRTTTQCHVSEYASGAHFH